MYTPKSGFLLFIFFQRLQCWTKFSQAGLSCIKCNCVKGQGLQTESKTAAGLAYLSSHMFHMSVIKSKDFHKWSMVLFLLKRSYNLLLLSFLKCKLSVVTLSFWVQSRAIWRSCDKLKTRFPSSFKEKIQLQYNGSQWEFGCVHTIVSGQPRKKQCLSVVTDMKKDTKLRGLWKQTWKTSGKFKKLKR